MFNSLNTLFEGVKCTFKILFVIWVMVCILENTILNFFCCNYIRKYLLKLASCCKTCKTFFYWAFSNCKCL